MSREAENNGGELGAVGSDALDAQSESVSGDPDDPFIGRRLKGTYELSERIGEGGMGTVYSATQHPLERKVAVKLVNASKTDDTGEHYFMREVQAINRLRHPNIVNIVDYGTDDDGLLYLVMEFLPGCTLRKVIADEFPLTPARVCDIAIQILRALEQAHESGVVHCDLKPANVMLEQVAGKSDFVKLLDFGIAKVKGPAMEAGPHTQAGDLVGTFDYMSPEQIMREEVDGRADVWSVGVILFELLTQRRIFRAEDAVGTVGRVMRAEIPSPSDFVDGVPPELEAIVARALTREVDDRPTASELRSSLEDLLDKVRATSQLGSIEKRELGAAPSSGLEGGPSSAAVSGPPGARVLRTNEATGPDEPPPKIGEVEGVGFLASEPADGIYLERAGVFEAVSDKLEWVGRGQAGGVLTTAPPGGGKSLFLSATLNRLSAGGWQSFVAPSAGRRDHSGLAFIHAWIRQMNREDRSDDLLADVLEQTGLEDDLEMVHRFLMDGFDDMETGGLPWTGIEEYARFVAVVLQKMVRKLLRLGPVCLAVDDFPVEDALAVDIVDMLFSALSDFPVFLLATSHTNFDSDGGASMDRVDVVSMERFDWEQVDQYMRLRLGTSVSFEVVERITEHTSGRPRMLEEFVLGLPGKSVSQPSTSASVSARLSQDHDELMATRIEEFDSETLEAARRMAVWGEAVPRSILESLDEAGYLRVDQIELLVAASTVAKRTDRRGRELFVFEPPGMRPAVYGAIPSDERRELHREAFQAVRELVGELPDFECNELLGHNQLGMGEYSDGTRAYIAAGVARRRRFDRAGAIGVWSRCAGRLLGLEPREIPGESIGRLVSILARNLREHGALDRALKVAKQVDALADVAEDDRCRVRLEVGHAETALGDFDKARRTLGRLWKEIGDMGMPQLELETLVTLIDVYEGLGEKENEMKLMRKAARRAGRISKSKLQALERKTLLWMPHNRLGTAVLQRNESSNALRILKAGLEIARAANDPAGLIRISSNLGAVYMASDKLDRAEELFERALDLARTHGDFLNQARILNNLGVTAMRAEHSGEAREQFYDARDLAERLAWKEGIETIDARIEKLDEDESRPF